MRLSLPGQTSSYLTEKRILQLWCDRKAHSPIRRLTEKRTLAPVAHERQDAIRRATSYVENPTVMSARALFTVSMSVSPYVRHPKPVKVDLI